MTNPWGKPSYPCLNKPARKNPSRQIFWRSKSFAPNTLTPKTLEMSSIVLRKKCVCSTSCKMVLLERFKSEKCWLIPTLIICLHVFHSVCNICNSSYNLWVKGVSLGEHEVKRKSPETKNKHNLKKFIFLWCRILLSWKSGLLCRTFFPYRSRSIINKPRDLQWKIAPRGKIISKTLVK